MVILKVGSKNTEISSDEIINFFLSDIEEIIQYDKELGQSNSEILDEIIGHVLCNIPVNEGYDEFKQLIKERWKL